MNTVVWMTSVVAYNTKGKGKEDRKREKGWVDSESSEDASDFGDDRPP